MADGSVLQASRRLWEILSFQNVTAVQSDIFDTVMLDGAVLVSKLKVEPFTLPLYISLTHLIQKHLLQTANIAEEVRLQMDGVRCLFLHFKSMKLLLPAWPHYIPLTD